jgi:hypothetical protein
MIHGSMRFVTFTIVSILTVVYGLFHPGEHQKLILCAGVSIFLIGVPISLISPIIRKRKPK